jgi:hypothetical protein
MAPGPDVGVDTLAAPSFSFVPFGVILIDTSA